MNFHIHPKVVSFATRSYTKERAGEGYTKETEAVTASTPPGSAGQGWQKSG